MHQKLKIKLEWSQTEVTLIATALDAEALNLCLSNYFFAWYSRAPTKRSIVRSPSPEHVSFLSFFSLSLWVSPSGHPAHHDQMAKDAPQPSQSPSPCSALCVTYLGGGTVDTPRARVCMCACVQPAFALSAEAQTPYDWSCHLSPIWQHPGTCEDGGSRGAEEPDGHQAASQEDVRMYLSACVRPLHVINSSGVSTYSCLLESGCWAMRTALTFYWGDSLTDTKSQGMIETWMDWSTDSLSCNLLKVSLIYGFMIILTSYQFGSDEIGVR